MKLTRWRTGLLALAVLGAAGLAVACQPTTAKCNGQTATIVGTAGNDTLNGTAAADVIAGLAGNDTIRGLGGNDIICGDADVAGNDNLSGGTGTDLVSYDQSMTGNHLDLAAGTSSIQGDDVLAEFENVRGGLAADVISGNSAPNRFVANRNDVLDGRGGNDDFEEDPLCGTACLIGLSYESATGAVTVDVDDGESSGAAGNDEFDFVPFGIVGSNFGDQLKCQTTVTPYECIVNGGGGSDVITGSPVGDELAGDLGNDNIIGGGGLDRATFYGFTAVNVNLATGTATGLGSDTLAGIEHAVGSFVGDTLRCSGQGTCEVDGGSGNDLLIAASNGSTLSGGPGDDTLLGGIGRDHIRPDGYGTAGNDTVDAGEHDDVVEADGGNDDLEGGPGHDTVDYLWSPAGLNADLGTGVVTGWGTDDVLGFETFFSGGGSDTIRGSNGPDRIDARNGGDTVFGQGGDDQLTAGEGTDWMHGGAGNDFMDGAQGNDMMYGGDDNDTVAFRYDTQLGQGVTADLSTFSSSGPQGSDRFLEMENLYGSERDDVLRGDAGPNRITGSAGIDDCSGGGGADVLSECP